MEEGNPSIFNISTEPEEDDSPQIILYTSEFDLFSEKTSTKKSGCNTCFNCDSSEHNLSNCPEKIDQRAISRNRALLAQRRVGLSNHKQFKRYHLEVEDAIKDDAVPGVISDELREALGIESTQLPPYIYRMRCLGYPPGWLEEAKLSDSGINMIDSNGDRVPNAEEEEGEIYMLKTKYDLSKLVEYPGFNVWPPSDTINETHLYGVPEMHFNQSKSAFIQQLKDEMEKEQEFKVPNVDMSEDMEEGEIEEGEVIEGEGVFIPPLPAEAPVTPPALPPSPPNCDLEEGELINEDDKSEITSKSPNKTTKRKLPIDDEVTPSKSPRESLGQACVGETTAESITEDNTTFNDCQSQNESLDSSFGRVISVEMGTPALKIHSPFTKLPSAEAFQKDITDVINFENLPNATGKYEKLKSVLRTVRDKLKIFRSKND